MNDESEIAFASGLEGVVAAETRLSEVDGEAGELIIAGFPVEELASRASLEEVIYLLWYDALPDSERLAVFREELAGRRVLPRAVLDLLRAAAAGRMPTMDALRMATGALSLDISDDESAADRSHAEALALVACLPTIVAAYWRLLGGEEPVTPDPELGHAANYLYMLTGEEPDAWSVRALETYLNAVADHGMNASTFAARVIVSTRSDVVSAVVGAIGALRGRCTGARPDRRSTWSSRSGSQAGPRVSCGRNWRAASASWASATASTGSGIPAPTCSPLRRSACTPPAGTGSSTGWRWRSRRRR